MTKEPLDPLAEGVRDYLDVLEGKKPAAEAEIGGKAELTNEQRRRIPNIVGIYRSPCTLCKAEPPCARFLWFRTDNPETPFVLGAVCRDCNLMHGSEELRGLLKAKLLEESTI